MALKLKTQKTTLAHEQKKAMHAAQQRWIDAHGGADAVVKLMSETPQDFFALMAECNAEGERVGREEYDAAQEARYAEAAEQMGKPMGECSNCQGTGQVKWSFANGRCFDCNGLGWVKA